MAVSSINALYDSEGRLPATFLGIVEPESAQAWTTATPVVLERFPKMRGPGKSIAVDSAEDQLRAMVRRQFDRDAHIEIWESSRAITRPGGHRTRLDAFRRMRVNKSNVHPPAVGVTITFDEPIRGPIVLGRLAHFGLGRFKPVR